MMKNLKNSFTQAALGSIIWITLLVQLFQPHQGVTLGSFWRLIGIGLLFGVIFGVIYPFLWNYATYRASTKVMLSTFFNTFCGVLSVYLYSSQLFAVIKPYLFGILCLTLLGHILGFYVYSKSENRHLAKNLNAQLKQ